MGKIYVVFEGKTPGIYESWPVCQSQVYRYKGNNYQSYKTYSEALEKWTAHCKREGYDEEYVRRGILIEKSGNNGGGSQEKVCNISASCSSNYRDSSQKNKYDGGSGFEEENSSEFDQHNISPTLLNFADEFRYNFAEDTSSLDWIIQKSMQKEVERMCCILRIPLPVYELQQVKVLGGVEYVKFCACLQHGARGTTCTLVGRYGKTTYDAIEDVAVMIIRQLLGYCGKKIRDFNHYSIEFMEQRVNMLEGENLELKMELARLNAELAVSRSKAKGKKY